MIQLTAQTRILVAIEPVDFRNGIDGLQALCKRVLASDPFSGTVFVFRNRRGTAVKVLTYDGQGFWLAQKRLSAGKFPHWPEAGEPAKLLEAHELHVLLSGGDPASARGVAKWRRVAATTG
jgi:transposase